MIKLKEFSGDYSALADAIKKELPELEKYIEKNFKIKCKLKFYYDKSKSRVDISSYSIMRDANSDVDKLLFKDICINLRGGALDTEENTSYIWFNILISYEHVVGGYNGSEIPHGQLYYNVQEHIWENAEDVWRRSRSGGK